MTDKETSYLFKKKGICKKFARFITITACSYKVNFNNSIKISPKTLHNQDYLYGLPRLAIFLKLPNREHTPSVKWRKLHHPETN